MGRPAASGVSAFSGFVANGRQAVHHVSSPPSKIPYGGFSPVRLQIGPLAATFTPAIICGALIRGRSSPRPMTRLPPSVWRPASGSANLPIQRPLARQWVMLSHQVIAYYGLIRGSEPLPPIFLLRYTAGLCRKAKAQSVPAFLCVSFLPCRLPYPGGPDGTDC